MLEGYQYFMVDYDEKLLNIIINEDSKKTLRYWEI